MSREPDRIEGAAGADAGGVTAIRGAIVGGLIIGVGEKLFEFWIGRLIGEATENWFAFVLALLFLVVRPQGQFDEKIIERVSGCCIAKRVILRPGIKTAISPSQSNMIVMLIMH